MSELDKTIEELEAEVLAELEEAEDPAKKGAAPAEKSDLKDESDKIKPEDAGKKAKEVSGDDQQKGEGAPDKMEKVKEGYTEEEIRELCHSKDHDCATVIEHPEFGLGKPVHGSHAIPDDEGNVEVTLCFCRPLLELFHFFLACLKGPRNDQHPTMGHLPLFS